MCTLCNENNRVFNAQHTHVDFTDTFTNDKIFTESARKAFDFGLLYRFKGELGAPIQTGTSSVID